MFDRILQFEQALAEFTGAPYAIMTDCCTHAIEMCLRYDKIKSCSFTAYTYLSIPMTMHKLGIRYSLEEESWIGEYKIHDTRIWDSARRLQRNMYRPDTLQCLSFGHTKPLHLGHGGAILLDDPEAYATILRQRYDGRDLTIAPWNEQKTFKLGFHYKPSIEDADLGVALLEGLKESNPEPKFVAYPDIRNITIED